LTRHVKNSKIYLAFAKSLYLEAYRRCYFNFCILKEKEKTISIRNEKWKPKLHVLSQIFVCYFDSILILFGNVFIMSMN